MMLTVGLLGAFTTISTFSYETIRLIDQNKLLLAILNIGLTLVTCLLAVYLGKMLVSHLDDHNR